MLDTEPEPASIPLSAKLAEPVAIDCIECPAGEFFNALSAQTGVPIYLAGALQSVSLSIYGIARMDDHMRAASIAMGASIYPLGNSYVIEMGEPSDVALLRDFGSSGTGGRSLPGGYSMVTAAPREMELLKRVDFRKRYYYVDLALASGLAEAELALGMDVSGSIGAEAGSLVASIGVEVDKEATIDVGEARYVRKTALQEGVLVEQDVQELRIPREVKFLLGNDGRLSVELKSDIVRGEAAGLPEIARTQYETVAYVDDRWRIIGTLTDRQTGAFLTFAGGATPNFRARGRARSSLLIARVREAEAVAL